MNVKEGSVQDRAIIGIIRYVSRKINETNGATSGTVGNS